MPIAFEQLQKLIQESGLVSDHDLAVAQEEATRTNRTLENVLVGEGYITEGYLAEILAPHYGVPIIDLKQTALAAEVVQLIPEALAKSKHAVVFEYDEAIGKAKVAMLDPLDLSTIEFLRAKLGCWVEPYLTTEASLRYGLRQYKKEGELVLDPSITENIEKSMSLSGDTDLSKTAEAVPIVTILDHIIEQAVALDATDIHFEPLESATLVRFRIDGVLQEVLSLPKVIAPILVARVKILANLHIDEHQVPQDGRFHFELEDGTTIDVRTNIMPV
ncbi:MAG TPA: ATPase, T2SS/T4P/T4SS family, partial [Candidatus Paceibacterota bacterium]